MINGRTVLGLIVARGGSKGLPGKNIADLGGRPLIAWTVEAAKGSRHLDRVILSTDSPEIAATARAEGCEVPFLRPAELATDTAPVIDAVRHAVDMLGHQSWDYIVLLQATSPFRRSDDIDRAIACCDAQGAPGCISICELGKPAAWLLTRGPEGRLARLVGTDDPAAPAGRRQDHDSIYVPNGAVYVARWDLLRRAGNFLPPDCASIVMERSRSIDIDTAEDLDLARHIMETWSGGSI